MFTFTGETPQENEDPRKRRNLSAHKPGWIKRMIAEKKSEQTERVKDGGSHSDKSVQISLSSSTPISGDKNFFPLDTDSVSPTWEFYVLLSGRKGVQSIFLAPAIFQVPLAQNNSRPKGHIWGWYSPTLHRDLQNEMASKPAPWISAGTQCLKRGCLLGDRGIQAEHS